MIKGHDDYANFPFLKSLLDAAGVTLTRDPESGHLVSAERPVTNPGYRARLSLGAEDNDTVYGLRLTFTDRGPSGDKTDGLKGGEYLSYDAEYPDIWDAGSHFMADLDSTPARAYAGPQLGLPSFQLTQDQARVRANALIAYWLALPERR